MEVPITKFGADHRVLHPVDNNSEAQGRLPDVIGYPRKAGHFISSIT
jgi:hypothetical protein